MSGDCFDVSPKITPENRREKIKALFGDELLADYMSGALGYNSLDDQQRALADAVDGVMVAMFDANLPQGNNRLLLSHDFRDALSNDGWIERGELNSFFSSKSVRLYDGGQESIANLERAMGEKNAKAFREFIAGVSSGVADEQKGVRYEVSEVDGFFSTRAREIMKQANKTTVLMFESNAIAAAVNAMQGLCATIKTDHSKEPCEADEFTSMSYTPTSPPMDVRRIG